MANLNDLKASHEAQSAEKSANRAEGDALWDSLFEATGTHDAFAGIQERASARLDAGMKKIGDKTNLKLSQVLMEMDADLLAVKHPSQLQAYQRERIDNFVKLLIKQIDGENPLPTQFASFVQSYVRVYGDNNALSDKLRAAVQQVSDHDVARAGQEPQGKWTGRLVGESMQGVVDAMVGNPNSGHRRQ